MLAKVGGSGENGIVFWQNRYCRLIRVSRWCKVGSGGMIRSRWVQKKYARVCHAAKAVMSQKLLSVCGMVVDAK